jgi:hypothetical protein
MENNIMALLNNLGWLNQDIENAREKEYLREANKSHIKRVWPSFTEEEIESTLDVFYRKGGENGNQ